MGVDVQFIVAGFGSVDERDAFVRRVSPMTTETLGLTVTSLYPPGMELVCCLLSEARYLHPPDERSSRSAYWPLIHKQAMGMRAAASAYTVLYTSDAIDSGSMPDLLLEAARGHITVVDDEWVAAMTAAHDAEMTTT